MIQSTLFQSPYSGDPHFSGWRPDPCKGPPASAYPPQQTSQNARYCVDAYRPGWRDRNPIKTPVRGAQPLPWSCKLILPGRFKVCQGPSATGPLTVRNPANQFRTGSMASARLE